MLNALIVAVFTTEALIYSFFDKETTLLFSEKYIEEFISSQLTRLFKLGQKNILSPVRSNPLAVHSPEGK